MEFFIGLIIVCVFAMLIHYMVLLSSKEKTYTDLLHGTVVGKYVGSSKKGGFVVVEATIWERIVDDNFKEIAPKMKSLTDTFEVPSTYFDKINIGDNGIFPFVVNVSYFSKYPK